MRDDSRLNEPFSEIPGIEPEIIPPRRSRAGAPTYGSSARSSAGDRPRLRVFVLGGKGAGPRGFKVPGPLTIAAILLGAGLLVGLVLFLALAALLIALPLLAVTASAAIAGAVLRGWWHRRRPGP